MNVKIKISKLKKSNPWLKWIWFLSLKYKEKKVRKINREVLLKAIFRAGHDYELNLKEPLTYADKLNWLKLNYRNSLMPIVSDKYEVRKYLEDLGYVHLLNDILGVWDNVKDIDIKSLPERFVLKSTHGSGPNWILIVKDKNKVNWFAQKLVMKQWLKNKIDWMGGEWHYGEMKPRIIAERFLEDENGSLIDYKIHCFNGNVGYILVCVGRAEGKLKFYCMSSNWEILKINKTGIESPECYQPPKPKNLDEMITIAKNLSSPFPVVRMDFYEVRGKIYFGEFTFFTNGGFDRGLTREGQNMMGDLITLPKANVKEYYQIRNKE